MKPIIRCEAIEGAIYMLKLGVRIISGAMLLTCALTPLAAQAQSTATTLTTFYATCLNSGGSPGLFKEAGSDTAQGGSAVVKSYAFTLAPSNSGLMVTISRKNAAGSALPEVKLYAGQTVTFVAGDFSYKHNFKLGEYCLRKID